MVPGGVRALLALLSLALAAGCELGQVTVAEPTSSLVAEVYLRMDDGIPDGVALLHRTRGSDPIPLDQATVEIRRRGGAVGRFQQRDPDECVDGDLPENFEVACYRLVGVSRFLVEAGARISVGVTLMSGETLDGVLTMPSDFRIRRPATAPGVCDIRPGVNVPIAWTQAEGAWAYVPEAEVVGLRAALADQDIVVASEPVTLLGLSVSQADTTINFPAEFGIFNRLSGDREVLVALQQGLPAAEEELWGRVVVSAQERNATNWNRGGIFNPSGQIRVPSLFGDGTGVAAGVVNRSFAFSMDAGGDFPDCNAVP